VKFFCISIYYMSVLSLHIESTDSFEFNATRCSYGNHFFFSVVVTISKYKYYRVQKSHTSLGNKLPIKDPKHEV